MINIHLSIANPWAKDDFDNLFNRSGLITEHKAWEFEVYRYSHDMFSFYLGWPVRSDHGGPTLTVGLFGYVAEAKIYDTRHWDSTRNCWTESD